MGEELSFTAALQDMMSAALESIIGSLEQIAETASQAAEAMSAAFSEASVDADVLAGSADAAAASTDVLAGSMDAATASTDANTEATDANALSQQKATDAKTKFAASAKAMIMPLGIAAAAVVGIGAAAIHMAGDFQSGLTSLVTGAGESQSNLQMIHDGILQMSVDTGESTTQLVDGMYMIESSGEHGAQALATLQAAAEGAKVGNADLGTVADATTTILNDFGNTGITASQSVNEMVATVAAGKTHMQDLGQALAQVLPTASAAGIGLSSVMGAMATMTSEGVPAANAATYLRQTILALEAPSAQTTKALASVGLSTKQVADEMHKSLPDALAMITEAVGKKFPAGSAGYIAALKAISGGSKQMQGVLDLTGQHMQTFETNTKNLGAVAKQGGNQITGWALVQKDFNQQLSQLGATAGVAMIKLGEALTPVATALVHGLTPALKSVGEWISGHGAQAAAAFGIIAAVLGGALVTALGAATVAFFSMDTAALPAIAVGAAIAGLAAGLVLAYHNIRPFHDAVDAVVTTLSHWRDGLQDVIGFFQMAKTPLEIVTGILLTAFLPALISSGIAAGTTAVTMAGSFISSVVASGVAMVVMAAQGIASAVTGFIAYAAAGWAAAAATIAATWPILLIIAAIAALVVGIILLVTHWKQVSAFLQGVWSAVVQGVGAGFSWLGEKAHGVVTTVGGWFSWLGAHVHSALLGLVALVRGTWQTFINDEVAAFHIPGDRIVKLHVGTWHAGPHFTHEEAMFPNLENTDANSQDFGEAVLPEECVITPLA